MKFEKFSTWHSRVRQERGFTQKEIAKKLGWSSSQYVSNIERGIAFLPKAKIRKIATIYKVSEAYIAMLVVADIKQDYLSFVGHH